jgi:hypothetical protein
MLVIAALTEENLCPRQFTAERRSQFDAQLVGVPNYRGGVFSQFASGAAQPL